MQNYIDARTDDAGADIQCELCIVGAGAAGITLARALAGSFDDIVLLESGSFDLEGATQRLYLGRNVGHPYYDLLACRLRYFGGTTNHWAGYCRANDPIDYQGRPELGIPAWPVAMEEIRPYIEQAARDLEIPGRFFDPGYHARLLDLPEDVLFDSKNPDLLTKVFEVTQNKRLAHRHREELGSASGLKILLNLNAVHLELAPTGDRLDFVRARTLTGKETVVRARTFVLACHAIENARLLLVSDNVHPSGIGNTHDHVGRYFMEHPSVRASALVPSPAFPMLYDWDYALRRDLNANVSLSARAMRELGILEYYCRFDPVYVDDKVEDAMAGVKQGFFAPFSLRTLRDLVTVMSDFGGAVESELNSRNLTVTLPRYYRLEHRIEQAPNPSSRVVLSETRDALNVRQADLLWSLSELDYKAFRVGHDLMVRELSALGAGRVVVDEMTPEFIDANVEGRYHHMGTTRMSDSERDGVVDRDARVHGVNNLYVLGSSIFPTAGYCGPTMMIMAFALRLAEHLRAQTAKYGDAE